MHVCFVIRLYCIDYASDNANALKQMVDDEVRAAKATHDAVLSARRIVTEAAADVDRMNALELSERRLMHDAEVLQRMVNAAAVAARNAVTKALANAAAAAANAHRAAANAIANEAAAAVAAANAEYQTVLSNTAKRNAAAAARRKALAAKTAAERRNRTTLSAPVHSTTAMDRAARSALRGQNPAPAPGPGAPGECQDPSNIHNNSSNIHNNSSETGSERSTDANIGSPKCSSLSGGNGEGKSIE